MQCLALSFVLAKLLNILTPLPVRHKGFNREEGWAANASFIRTLVEEAQSKISSLHIAWVKFKNFDLVGHPSLQP